MTSKKGLESKLNKKQVDRINDTQNYLMSLIDIENDMEIEKVERYGNLLKLFYALDLDINEIGTTVTIINGSQEYTKPNPALAEKNRVNGALLSLEKSFNLDKRAEQKRLEEAAKGPELT
ncbi:hypothetical protein XA22_13680 [Staphylococcus cohnii subsp. cohnii]|nr:hypothetical protein XA22_13680 [Staphylococcus cohnii subsp. cohnii]KKD25191.1 hypothetical protein XA21_02770 [Staphylococcus cohnii subsp. cohnii]